MDVFEKKEGADLEAGRKRLEKPVQLICFAGISLVRIFLVPTYGVHNTLQNPIKQGENRLIKGSSQTISDIL